MLAGTVNAAELVMFRRDGCPYCGAWDREIGPIYSKTEIGKRVPLHMIDLDRDDARAIHTRTPIRYTPTFVLVENGEEVGRIQGYPGDAFFWGLLDRLLEKLPPAPAKGNTSADTLPAKPVEGIRMSSACCTTRSAGRAKAGNASPPIDSPRLSAGP